MRSFYLLFLLTIVLVFPLIFLFANFIPSKELQQFWPFAFLGSLALAIAQFIKFKTFWTQTARQQVLSDGVVKTATGADFVTVLSGIGLPLLYFYVTIFNCIPLMITYAGGYQGSTAYVYKSRITSITTFCRSGIKLEDTAALSRVCGIKNKSGFRLKRGDEILLRGIKSWYGIIPTSYELIES